MTTNPTKTIPLADTALICAGVFLVCIIFIIDLNAPSEIEIGSLYSVIIALSSLFPDRYSSFYTAGGCTVLIFTDLSLSKDVPNSIYAINHAVSVVPLWATAILVMTAKKLRNKLRASENSMENQVELRIKELQEKLLHTERSERKYRGLIDGAPDAIIIAQKDGLIQIANAQAEKMFGYSKKELEGSKVEMLIAPSLAKDHRKHRKEFFKSPKFRIMAPDLELFAVRQDSTQFPVEINLSPLNTEEGVLVTAAIRDISEQRKSEENLRQMSDRLKLATGAAKIGIWEFDLLEDHLEWDDTMFELYGMTKDNFCEAYEAWQEGLHPDDASRAEKEVQLALEDKKPFNTEFRIIWPDSSVHHIRARAIVQRDKKGKPLCMIGANWDISQQKRSEEISRNMAMLKSKNQEMEQFAYVASHDLREPLLTIKNYAQLLAEDCKNKRYNEMSHITSAIVKASTRMEELIIGLLEYSRLGSNTRHLRPVNCDRLVEGVLNDLNRLIKSNNASIKTTNLPGLKAFRIELGLLFQNLIHNAIKFKKANEQPIIEISSEKIDNGWQFQVRDNGIGISEKHKDKIFTIFRRLHKKKEYEGSGIGLAQAKKIVELHNGDIWIESTPEIGTSFYFTILTESE